MGNYPTANERRSDAPRGGRGRPTRGQVLLVGYGKSRNDVLKRGAGGGGLVGEEVAMTTIHTYAIVLFFFEAGQNLTLPTASELNTHSACETRLLWVIFIYLRIHFLVVDFTAKIGTE